MNFFVRSGWVIVGVAVAACSSSTNGTSSTANGGSTAQGSTSHSSASTGSTSTSSGTGGSSPDPTAFIQEVCAVFTPCCPSAGASAQQACVTGLTAAVNGLIFQPTAAATCLAALDVDGAPVCASPPDPTTCAGAFVGAKNVAAGTACKRSSDCAPASGGSAACVCVTGDGSAACTENVCVQTTAGTVGTSPCVDTSVSGAPPSQAVTCAAASNLYCNHTSGQCTTLGSAGESCPCDSADFCQVGTTATCVADKGLTQTCTGGEACVAGAYCNTTLAKCEAVTPMGMACKVAGQCGTAGTCLNGLCVNALAADFLSETCSGFTTTVGSTTSVLYDGFLGQ